MKTTLTTREAATLLGTDPRSFHRWAHNHDLHPLRHQRIGRSTLTIWSVDALRHAVRRAHAGQTPGRRGEISKIGAVHVQPAVGNRKISE